tara:strand:- start:9985 stop:10416 length:432 start_codon:yes stop_codon:yes gene_type:complete
MKKKTLILTALIGIFMSGCKDDDDGDVSPDPTPDPIHNHSAPKITINDPKLTYYHLGDTVFVNAVITDEEEMHEAKCWFITQPQNDTLWYLKRHSHSKAVVFDSFFVLENLAENQKVDFVVWGENDHGKTATAKHSFEVHDDH